MKSYKQFRIEQVERLEEEPITTAAVVGGLWKAAAWAFAAKGAYDTAQSIRKKEPWHQTVSKGFSAIPMLGTKRAIVSGAGQLYFGSKSNQNQNTHSNQNTKLSGQKLKTYNQKMNRPANASAPDSQGNYWVRTGRE